ncbi:hypothetical protein JCM3765_007420 [Sporobolomyces pararoseus]
METPRIQSGTKLPDDKNLFLINQRKSTFANSGLSFRAWNKYYEKMLDEEMYGANSKTRIAEKGPDFDGYLSERALESTRWREGKVLGMDRKLLDFFGEYRELIEYRAVQWGSLPKSRREEIILGVFMEDVRTTELAGETYARNELPEFTVEWMSGFNESGTANWLELLQRLSVTEEERKESEREGGQPYRSEIGTSVRALSVIATVKSEIESLRQGVVDNVARENLEVDKTSNMLADLERLYEPPTCAYCGSYEQFLKTKILYCSKCKKIDRDVMYCSADCQQGHWNTETNSHRPVCGKLLSTLPIPSLAPTKLALPASPSSSTGLTPSNEYLAEIKKMVKRQKDFALSSLKQGEYCWIDFEGIPEETRESKIVMVFGSAILTGKSRLKLREVLRSIAFDFLEDEEEDDRKINLAVVLVHTIQLLSDSGNIHARWLTRLIDRKGRFLDHFVKVEFPERLKKGLEVIRAEPKKYRVVQNYLDSPSKHVDYEEDSERTLILKITIQSKLKEDPTALWFTGHPRHLKLNIFQYYYRIAAPILKSSNSKTGGNQRNPVTALRERSFRVIEDLRNIRLQDFDALGVLMLAVTSGSGPRATKWLLWQMARDLNTWEGKIRHEMERMGHRIRKRQEEDSELLEEAFRIIAEQKSNEDDDAFPSTLPK